MTRCITCRHFTDEGNAEIVKMAKLGAWSCKLAPVGLYYPVLRNAECATYRGATEAEVQRRRDWYADYQKQHKKWKVTQ